MSENEYESLLETLALLSVPGFKERFELSQEEIERGETVAFAEVFGEPL